LVDLVFTWGWWFQEDEAVRKLVDQHGGKSWTLVASFLPNRSGQQTQQRWHNKLDPNIVKGPPPTCTK
jgi:hypothetical protein